MEEQNMKDRATNRRRSQEAEACKKLQARKNKPIRINYTQTTFLSFGLAGSSFITFLYRPLSTVEKN